jgi:hypothetical protein
MIKKILAGLFFLAAIGAGVGVYLWNKPHVMIEDKKGLVITAKVLFETYNANEKDADAQYLNKAIEVTGVVGEVEKNQDGGTMLILDTGDPIAGVQCAMREQNINVAKGAEVTIKGFCSGNGITGVSLTDCIIKQ